MVPILKVEVGRETHLLTHFHGLYQCAVSKEQIAEITWTYYLFILAWLCKI